MSLNITVQRWKTPLSTGVKIKSVKGKISLYYYENIFDLTDLLKGSWRLPSGPKPHFEDCWPLGFSVGLDVRE